ncbi:MAG TPA: RNA 2',3'-cyclic phosphodiesterase [Thermodesulfovibrionales bacterium]|nr:RNA 2',3'-cyclic phosphodiesterase [Thermodesulfovibrionales bacterium]
MRSFVAINLDDSLRNEIDRTTAGLKSGNWDVKWVAPANLHITLKFLGEIPEDAITGIKETLLSSASHHESFALKFKGVGIFPDKRRPRVIWIDILESEKLIKLQKEVENSLSLIGFKEEDRPFSPHLTIGRIKSSAGKESLLRAMEALKDRDFGNIGVNKVSLMKSDLKPGGAQYTTIAEFNLKRRSNDQ